MKKCLRNQKEKMPTRQKAKKPKIIINKMSKVTKMSQQRYCSQSLKTAYFLLILYTVNFCTVQSFLYGHFST